MRKYFAISFILIVVGICFTNCGTDDLKNHVVYLFIDASEPEFDRSIILDDIKQIEKLFNPDNEETSYHGCKVKIFIINNISENRSETIRLPIGKAGLLGQNILDREQVVKVFIEDLNIKVNALIEKTNFGTSQSKIYQNLCREVNTLVSEEKGEKYVIVYSDMLENSDYFSFYEMEDEIKKSLINDDLSNLTQSIESDCTLKNLDGIFFYIVAYRSPVTDAKVNLAQRFWVKYLTQNDATVFFDAELDMNY